MKTFGEKLEFFTKSIDFIDDRFFKSMMNLIKRYVEFKWDIKVVKIIQLKIVENIENENCRNSENYDMVLERYFLDRQFNREPQVNMNANTQMAFVIRKKEAAWITCKKGNKTLRDCSKYKDCWSDLKDIAQYSKPNLSFKAKTSIIIPFFKDDENGKDILGVVNFESSKYLKCDNETKCELKLLSRVISELIYLNHIYHRNTNNTEKAIDTLYDGLFYNIYNQERDTIFLAFLNKTDKKNY